MYKFSESSEAVVPRLSPTRVLFFSYLNLESPVNDSTTTVTNCWILKFADDTKIFNGIKDKSEVVGIRVCQHF